MSIGKLKMILKVLTDSILTPIILRDKINGRKYENMIRIDNEKTPEITHDTLFGIEWE
jgi:hypothetical protein